MKEVYFIGIGGIGISALARYFLSQGWSVSGSDIFESEITNDLKKEGVKVFIGQTGRNISPRTNLVIFTAAVKEKNAELRKARTLSIKTQSYAQALGDLTKKYWTIAVSGSHGKSTTTALISLILIKAGFDPTIIIGTKLKELGDSNFRAGKSRFLIIEADEWNRSFLNYRPQIIILTNIDKEHLDTYGSEAKAVKTFSEYVGHLPKSGILIANWRDKNSRMVAQKSGRKVIFYNQNKFNRYRLNVPGAHNQLNAEAAWQCAKALGIKRALAGRALSEYTGAWRRLERIQNSKFKIQNLCIYSDYAHHPTEIKATLQALREKHPKQKIFCVFQPHQADRLTRLFSDFKNAFKEAHKVILLPVYKPADRELLENEKTSVDLYEAIKNRCDAFYCNSFNKIKTHIKSANKNSVFVFMSAGNLDPWLRQNL